MNQIKNPIKLLEKIWKIGLVVFVVGSLIFGSLVLRLSDALAHGNPNMTARLTVNDDNDSPDQGWQKVINSQAGHRLSFTLEIHNTVVDTEAHEVKARVVFPSGNQNNINVVAFASATNANTASDAVTINIPTSSSLSFVSGSTRLYWDRDGDGVKEFDNAPLVDGIVPNGLAIGHQKGCNQYIMQITFMAEVVGPIPSPTPTPTPTPTPSPTPSPTPTPTPAAGGNTNTNTNTNTNNVNVNNSQTQTVNVAGAAASGAATTAQVQKQPVTGPGVLGMVTMAGGLPLGLALARYGRGQVLIRRKDERLGELADGLAKDRLLRKGQT